MDLVFIFLLALYQFFHSCLAELQGIARLQSFRLSKRIIAEQLYFGNDLLFPACLPGRSHYTLADN